MRPHFAQVILLVVFSGFAFPSPALAQGARYEGRRIATIQFVPQEQPLEPAEINQMLPLKIKAPLRMADVEASIERLFATGRYEDIQVDAQPHGEDVIIRFITRASNFIGHVSVAGDLPDPPNRGQLVGATRLDLGQPLTDDKMVQAQEGIKNLLANNGLYESRVRPEFIYDSEAQQVHIRFVIDGGRRARFTTPIIKGDLKVPTEKLISETGWRRWLLNTWKPVTQSRVRQGIDNIRLHYEKQGRLEVKVGLESLVYDSDTNRALPTLEIDAGPRIQVRTIGAKLSQKKIRQHVPIYQEHTVDYALLAEGARNLEDYYQSLGYFEVEIEPKQQRVTNDRATIDYLVNTGTRHRLMRVEVTGNRYFGTDTIRERMFLRPASLLQFRHGRYSERLLRRDEDAIVNLYQSNGFRDAAVQSRIEDNYGGKNGDIAVYLNIEEGPQWFVNSLQIEGIRSLDVEQVRQMLGSAEGQPFSDYSVGVDRDTILAQYFARGFPNASFEWSFRPAAQPNRMDLRFVIDEGGQQFVRQVLISGLESTSQSLVARNILLNPGDPLSPQRMTETQRRLYELGVFAKVDTAIQNPDGETDRKFVLYNMEEASKWSVSTGFGAEIAKIGGCRTCLESPAGQAGFAPRVSFNVARQNLWGLAHTLSFRSRVSTLQQRGLVNYSAPRFRNVEGLNLLFTGLYDRSFNVRTFSSERFEGAVQLSQRVSKATTLFYRYTYRRVGVDEESLKISPLLIPQLAQPVRVGMISGNLVEDRRDDPVDPRKGVYNTLDIGLAEGIFGSQRDFLRFLGRNATYHPIGRRLVLARNITFGTLGAFHYSGDPDQAIPLPERFFSGGGTSHRGFPEQQAGPRDLVTGFPLGGSALLFNQVELRMPLVGENISGVLFHDAGNVYSKLGDISFRVRQRNLQDFNYMVHAAGFGIRYRTPVGPLRVDFGYSINPPRFFGFDSEATRQDLLEAGVDPCRTQPARCIEQRISHFQFSFSIGQTF
ncbi:MAG TPA: POTRA domain-containing protein [Bryobacteraceae bacterium]|nr:POTRA domain-containing protein [Bryobacteraceae bacterium]